MRQAVVPSQYLQIALDLATRIAQGELTEGSRIYGRSVLASEYGVSPETIRKALRLLADMKVVDVKPQSGGRSPLWPTAPAGYIENFSEDADIHSLRLQLKALLAESAEVNRRMADTVSALVKGQDTFAAAGQPLPNYEVPVPKDSPLIGKSIGELKFWQSTRRHHRGHPAGPDGDPLPRSLCRTVQRRRHHPGGKPQRRRGRPPASNDKGVKAAI